MDKRFQNYIELLDPLFQQLMRMEPAKGDALPPNMPAKGRSRRSCTSSPARDVRCHSTGNAIQQLRYSLTGESKAVPEVLSQTSRE